MNSCTEVPLLPSRTSPPGLACPPDPNHSAAAGLSPRVPHCPSAPASTPQTHTQTPKRDLPLQPAAQPRGTLCFVSPHHPPLGPLWLLPGFSLWARPLQGQPAQQDSLSPFCLSQMTFWPRAQKPVGSDQTGSWPLSVHSGPNTKPESIWAEKPTSSAQPPCTAPDVCGTVRAGRTFPHLMSRQLCAQVLSPPFAGYETEAPRV